MGTGKHSSNRSRKLALLLASAALIAAVALGAGCGDSGIEDSGQSEPAGVVPAGPVRGEMTISQWPLYVDPGPDGTVAEFEQDTGVDVKYIEEINDNAQFFGKIQAQLEQGDSGGRSLITVSDWLAKKMYDLGYLMRLDHEQLPNVDQNLIPALQHPPADPERDFTVPWQAGMTGLIVNKDLAPDADSIADLFDPQYKGKVSMLTELRDTVPLTLKSMGIDPDTATTDQWLEAVDKIKAAADSGQIRHFTGNDYIKDLAAGDTAIAMGWSGDAVQLQNDNPNIEFVMPEEGCMLWSTSMEIPVGSPNPQAAEAFMNYVYDPHVQADIAQYVNYVTPVSGVKEILAKRDPELAHNELIFPSKSYTADCTYEPVLGGEQGEIVTKAFEQVLTGAG
jgi:spermidine/putrescine transport system substrate-binding protein